MQQIDTPLTPNQALQSAQWRVQPLPLSYFCLMKTLFNSAVILSVGMLALASCKKDDPQPSVGEQIVGTWNLEVVESQEFFNGTLVLDTNFTFPGTQVEFLNNGTMYLRVFGIAADTNQWVLVNNSTIKIDDEINTILLLNGNNFDLKAEGSFTDSSGTSSFIDIIRLNR
jgi:hypothetical protein